jgi:hypothetical protein
MREPLKEAYEPPEILRVKLAKDEMAVVGCKRTIVSAGPTGGCIRPPTPCRIRGS